MEKTTYIQIGVKSKRTPTGEFLPAEPIYALTNEKRRKSGFTLSEEKVLHEIALLLIPKFLEFKRKEEMRRLDEIKAKEKVAAHRLNSGE